MTEVKREDEKPLETSPASDPLVLAHDWAGRITQNPDGTINYQATPATLPDGSVNPMHTAMRHMRIILGQQG